MAILDSVMSIFRRQKPTTTIDETAGPTNSAQPASLNARFGGQAQRVQVIEDCRRMYLEDPRAKTILGTLARDIVKGGFRIETNNPRATEIADALVKRLKLQNRLDDWTRLTFRDGDCFLELGVSDARRIDAISRKPTLRMNRNSDEADCFPIPERAYWLSKSGFSFASSKPGEDDIWFADWQILHARWDHDEGNRYGRPLMAASLSAWKRMKEGELDVAIRRKTRSGLKFIHRLAGGDEAAILKYQEDNKAALSDPFAAVADMFISGEGQVDVIQGDARLGEIEDILHHVRTFFMSSPVPMNVLGYGESINYSVVQHQKMQYDETLVQIQEWVASAFIWPILEIEWLLNGLLSENLEPVISWASKKQIDADQVYKIAQAVSTFRLLGLSETAIMAVLAHFLPGIEIGDALDSDPAGAQTDELAKIAQTLGARIEQRPGQEEEPAEPSALALGPVNIGLRSEPFGRRANGT
jgi:hypothetical protein